ncbi:hypothetical protein SRHO_G00099130 [Serrasalmus rhombeus]
MMMKKIFLQLSLIWAIIPTVSAQPQINISAKVGSSVLLPCDFSSKLSSIQKPHIEWIISSEIVFERGGNESFQGYSYEDRVDVPEDKLSHGDGSLVLKDVRHADERIYKCKLKMKTGGQKKWVFIQGVSLSVEEFSAPPEPTKESLHWRNAGVNCPSPWILALCLLSYFLFHRTFGC